MNPWIDIDTRWEPHLAIRPTLMKVVEKVYEDHDPTCPPSDRSPSLAFRLEPEDLLEPCVVMINLHDSQKEGVHFMINLNNNLIRDKYKQESFHAPSELSSVFSKLRQYIRELLRYKQERKEAAERRQREDEEKRCRAELKKLKEQRAREKVFPQFSHMVPSHNKYSSHTIAVLSSTVISGSKGTENIERGSQIGVEPVPFAFHRRPE